METHGAGSSIEARTLTLEDTRCAVDTATGHVVVNSRDTMPRDRDGSPPRAGGADLRPPAFELSTAPEECAVPAKALPGRAIG